MDFDDYPRDFMDIEEAEILTPTEKGEFGQSRRKSGKDSRDSKVNVVHKEFYNGKFILFYI
jgi:hypothetical protein